MATNTTTSGLPPALQEYVEIEARIRESELLANDKPARAPGNAWVYRLPVLTFEAAEARPEGYRGLPGGFLQNRGRAVREPGRERRARLRRRGPASAPPPALRRQKGAGEEAGRAQCFFENGCSLVVGRSGKHKDVLEAVWNDQELKCGVPRGRQRRGTHPSVASVEIKLGESGDANARAAATERWGAQVEEMAPLTKATVDIADARYERTLRHIARVLVPDGRGRARGRERREHDGAQRRAEHARYLLKRYELRWNG